MDQHRKLTIIALGAILILDAGLHMYRIGEPAKPVFDEVYFATQAADYLKGIHFLDIHPPLGKLVYATVLRFTAPAGLKKTEFIRFHYSPYLKNTAATSDDDQSFEDYPYLALRMTGAFFGLLLVLSFYFFLRSIGISGTGALLGALFVVLEDAILMETRLILLNGMFLSFGFLALALFFKKHPWFYAAGAMLGFAFGVKLIALVFLGPLVLGRYILSLRQETQRVYARSLLKIGAVAVPIFLVIFASTNFFFTPEARYHTMESLHMLKQDPAAFSPIFRDMTSWKSYLLISVVEGSISVNGYVAGPQDSISSPWYFWPLMQIPFDYFGPKDSGHPIRIVGNPAVWLGGTLAVVFALALLPRFFRRNSWMTVLDPRGKSAFFVLLFGYFFSLFPFMTFVRRATYLYHYFPALLFSLGLLVWFFDHYLRLGTPAALTKRQGIVLALAVFVVLVGFASSARFVYGL